MVCRDAWVREDEISACASTTKLENLGPNPYYAIAFPVNVGTIIIGPQPYLIHQSFFPLASMVGSDGLTGRRQNPAFGPVDALLFDWS